jgi:RNA 3'-phosphate cyclase
MSNAMVELDGSFGEGGGQILRTSLTLSLLTGRPFQLRNIRAGRSKPGLQPQHLTCVQAAAAIGKAATRGASIGSCDLVFEPGSVTPGSYTFDVGTAGATSLVLHTLYLPLCLGATHPSELTLIGGTHVTHSPSFHFLDSTWRHYLAHFGIHVSLRMRRPGFYPRGGGQVEVSIQPCAKPTGATMLARGPIDRVRGFSFVAGLDKSIGMRQLTEVESRLRRAGLSADLTVESRDGGPGTFTHLVVDTAPAPTSFFGLGELRKSSEKVAAEAADQMLAYLAAGPALVDAHSADQIVLPLALAEGPSDYTVAEVTQHLLTNIAVIGKFIDRSIICDGEEGKSGRVRIA